MSIEKKTHFKFKISLFYQTITNLNVLIVLGAFFLGLSIALFSYFSFDQAFFTPGGPIDPTKASLLGSFLSGMIGVLVAISSTILLFVNFIYQTITTRHVQIENTVFKLIDYHKENISRFAIYSLKGERFEGYEAIEILNEKFKLLFHLVNEKLTVSDIKEKINITYLLFFYGFKEGVFNTVKDRLNKYTESEFNSFIEYLTRRPPDVSYCGSDFSISESSQHLLGHYFRNIYNIVKFLDKEKSLSNSSKEFYIKLLRTQLSNSEIWLLFINSLSEIGSNWNNMGFIEKYQLIKNLPSNYHPQINPKEFYPSIIFEYEEVNIS